MFCEVVVFCTWSCCEHLHNSTPLTSYKTLVTLDSSRDSFSRLDWATCGRRHIDARALCGLLEGLPETSMFTHLCVYPSIAHNSLNTLSICIEIKEATK